MKRISREKLDDFFSKAMAMYGISPGSKPSAVQAEKVKDAVTSMIHAANIESKEAIRLSSSRSMSAIMSGLSGEVESPLEEVMVDLLAAAKITNWKPQFRIGPYRADFAFPGRKVVVECDGKDYHSSPADVAMDQNRDRYLARAGWKVVRLPGWLIRNEPTVALHRIRLALR